MLEYMQSHLSQTLMVVGLLLLAIEILVLGFSTFVLFYLGCATIITGILISFKVLPEDMLIASGVIAVLSAIIAVVSWKPLKALQNDVEVSKTTNDMIGHRFVLEQDLKLGQSITLRYSGIDWAVSAKQAISQGVEVEVTDITVGRMVVAPAAA